MTEPAPPIATLAVQSLPVLANEVSQGQLVPLNKLDPAQQRQALEISKSVSVRDSNGIATFGAAPQRKLGAFLDRLLAGISTNDTGVAGELVVELSRGIKAMRLGDVKKEAEGDPSWLARLPWVGGYFSAFRRFRAMHTAVLKHLNEIEAKANIDLGKLKANNSELDKLLVGTEENLRELELWIVGGQQALLGMRDEFERTRSVVADSGDAMKLVMLRDMAEQINAFETRLVRMQIAFSRGLLSIPKIRTTQQAGRIEIQNTLDSLLFDLPEFKSAIVTVAALRQISKANETTAARRRLARELGEIGMEALDHAYTSAKQSQGDMADDVASLSRLADKMVLIVEKGAELDRDNRSKRAEAVGQIQDINRHLVEGLRSASKQIAQG